MKRLSLGNIVLIMLVSGISAMESGERGLTSVDRTLAQDVTTNYKNESEILDLVLSHPIKALHEINSLRVCLGQIAHQKGLNIENIIDENNAQYQECVSKLKIESEDSIKKNLIWIGECNIQQDGTLCLLSRLSNPNARAMFEEHQSQSVITFLKSKKKEEQFVRVAVFGSGSAFPELRWVSQVLNAFPEAQIDLDLIDLRNKAYMKACKKQMKDYQIRPTETIDTKSVLSKKEDQKDAAYMQVIYKGLLGLWMYHFPKSKINICAFDTMTKYLSYIAEEGLRYPDRVCAVDLLEGSNKQYLMNTMIDYQTLCVASLQGNTQSSNLWLEKNDKNIGELRTITQEKLSENSFLMQNCSELFNAPLYETITPITDVTLANNSPKSSS